MRLDRLLELRPFALLSPSESTLGLGLLGYCLLLLIGDYLGLLGLYASRRILGRIKSYKHSPATRLLISIVCTSSRLPMMLAHPISPPFSFLPYLYNIDRLMGTRHVLCNSRLFQIDRNELLNGIQYRCSRIGKFHCNIGTGRPDLEESALVLWNCSSFYDAA